MRGLGYFAEALKTGCNLTRRFSEFVFHNSITAIPINASSHQGLFRFLGPLRFRSDLQGDVFQYAYWY
jgi:hypothetical protein